VIQALRAAERLIDGRQGAAPAAPAPPPADWEPRLAALAADPRPGVRVTALEAAGSWKLSGPLADRLTETAIHGTGRMRGTAVVALAKAEAPRAKEIAALAAIDTDPDLRAQAAGAAGLLGDEDLLGHLEKDASPLVREAVLNARLAAADPKAAAAASIANIARGGLADPDAGVRAAALDWLVGHPVLPIEVLRPALADTLHDSTIESGLSAVKALVARAQADARERGAITEILEKGATDLKYVLRREAMNGLGRLGRPVTALAPVEPDKPAETYREIVQRTSRPRRVELRTSKGVLRLRLACPEAPLTCLNFLTLASQGFYEGLLFHRVVPDFVIQAGDPRGDGFGGPGYTIRDEINLLRYKRGMVGMALAGPDTGGSQFFITLSPQPHLDGGYTIFGEVEQGMDVLDRIEAGDRIEKVVELR
jgi:cyclophilin family peptidyl-prolyl cis-trans isomerase